MAYYVLFFMHFWLLATVCAAQILGGEPPTCTLSFIYSRMHACIRPSSILLTRTRHGDGTVLLCVCTLCASGRAPAPPSCAPV